MEVSQGDGKGCAAYHKEDESVTWFFKINMDTCQALSFKISGKDIQLTLVYLSSGTPINEQTNVEQMIKKIPVKAKNHIVIGDFNFDAKESNIMSNLFTKEMGLTQLIKRPTHRDGRTIDHCYVSPEINCDLTFVNHYYTDHTAICIKLK